MIDHGATLEILLVTGMCLCFEIQSFVRPVLVICMLKVDVECILQKYASKCYTI